LAIVCGIGRIAPDARRKAVNNPQRGQKTDPNTVSSLKKGEAPENAHRQQTMAEGIKRFLSSLLERFWFPHASARLFVILRLRAG
jgi:hypothetical protein